jgi:hypothetical protein
LALLFGISPAKSMNDNKGNGMPKPDAAQQNYPILVAASWSRPNNFSDSYSRCSSRALLYKANLPIYKSHSIVSFGYLSVNWADSGVFAAQ